MDPIALAPVFEIAVLAGPPVIAVWIARVVRGKNYDLFAEA